MSDIKSVNDCKNNIVLEALEVAFNDDIENVDVALDVLNVMERSLSDDELPNKLSNKAFNVVAKAAKDCGGDTLANFIDLSEEFHKARDAGENTDVILKEIQIVHAATYGADKFRLK